MRPEFCQIVAAVQTLGADEAVAKCNQVLAEYPDEANVWLLKAQLLQEGDKDRSLFCLACALRLDAMLADAWCLLGKLARQSEAIDRALLLQPENPRFWHVKGELSEGQDAIECFQRAVELDPNDGHSWLCLAELWLELGRRERAEACLENARGLVDAQPRKRAVRLKRRSSPTVRVIEALTEGEGLEPLIVHLLQRGELQAALKISQLCTDKQPDKAHLWNNQGACWFLLGRIEKAAECFAKALQLDPSNPYSLRMLARCAQV